MPAHRRPILALVSLALISLSCGLAPAADAPPARFARASGAALRAAPLDATTAAVADFFARRRSGMLPFERVRTARTLVAESRRCGLPPALVLAVIEVESGGDPFAVSSARALGLMQLRPTTAEALAARAGVRWQGPATLFDPVANVRLGVAYLGRLVRRFGDLPTALAAYNWGPTHVGARQRRGVRIPEVYPRRVMAAYRRAFSPTS